MFDVSYILFLAIGGAFCGIAGLLGASCAITQRAVIAAAFQGMLLGTCVTMGIDWFVGEKFSGLAVGVGGIVATFRMALVVPIFNILIKMLYDVLFTFIHRDK
ncbi:MAG: hypothetical protein IJF84_00475 [Thermoguttaceae bacterium]|nr:hypothetical protein [Thermoguttaceae bacterium]